MRTGDTLPEGLEALEVHLGKRRIGHLFRVDDGVFRFQADDWYINAPLERRATLSLSLTDPRNDSATRRKLKERRFQHDSLPPFFSNLLPDPAGQFRILVAKELGIDERDEFSMIRALGEDLPGNVRIVQGTAKAELDQSGVHASSHPSQPESMRIKFSLAGAQLKFSMFRDGNRFLLPLDKRAGNYIVKPPSGRFDQLPENEYTCMRLAEAVGVEIPEIDLVPIDAIDGLPMLPAELRGQRAYVIKRFDRKTRGRIHMEDLAQAFGKLAVQKYELNYETVAKLLENCAADPASAIEQFVRRLVVNVLIGNGDAHLKNWSLLYPDGRFPVLSPAYDLVSTIRYLPTDNLALKLGGTRDFSQIDEDTFRRFAERAGLNSEAVLATVKDTIEVAQERWPRLRASLPASEEFWTTLEELWEKLKLRINHGALTKRADRHYPTSDTRV